MWRLNLEGHAAHGYNGDFPAGEPVQGIQQVLSGPPPSRKFADQDGVDLSCLRQVEYPRQHELAVALRTFFPIICRIGVAMPGKVSWLCRV